jgi:eukaryotic-like serine/threonine-protein kinase
VGTSGQGDALIGRRIHGYVVQRKLGEGGMGAVYEVLQPGIGKRLALKVLHAEYAKKDPIVQRFFAEARAVNQIGHPNIVDILNYDQLEDGTYFILMEFLEGVSLARYIQQRGPMTPPEVAEIILPMADALAAAHHHGIVHRDLKPENVQLVDRHGNPRYVKLLDFGIAKLSSSSSPDAAGGMAGTSGTKTGQVMGTPTYMSPEQAMGRTKEIDHRTDVYALGIIMYQMLTGDVPFHADSFGDLMLLHLQQTPPALQYRRPDLPPVWNDIIQICLAKSREHRFGSMRELADAIRAALAGQPLARPPQPIGPHGTVALGPAPYVPSSYASAAPTAPGADRTAPSGGYPATAPGSYPGTGPGTGPGAAWQAVPPASTGVSRPRRWLLPALLAAVVSGGVATAAILATRGNGAPAAAVAIDAAAPPDATPPDAAIAPPDAAVVAAPPDATVVDPRPDRPPPDDEREARGKTGTVRVSAIPWANVTINGKRYGQTPVTATVPAGKRIKVQAVNPELGTRQSETVIVGDGETRTVRFTMSGN